MSDTARRAIAGLATFAAPFIAAFLTSKGITVTDAQVALVVVTGLGYIGQSVANTIHQRAVGAATPAASTVPSAALDLAKGPA